MKDKDSIFIFSHSFLGLSVARCRLSSLSFRSPQKFSSNATLSGLNTSWWITNLRHAVFLTKHSIHVLTCDENFRTLREVSGAIDVRYAFRQQRCGAVDEVAHLLLLLRALA